MPKGQGNGQFSKVQAQVAVQGRPGLGIESLTVWVFSWPLGFALPALASCAPPIPALPPRVIFKVA